MTTSDPVAAQGSEICRLGDTPCDQPPHFVLQVLQDGLSDRETAALNSPGGGGMVLNVTGGSAFFGMPFYATYSPTKAGLARFGEAMRRELNGEGVHVMTVYPAAADTPILATNHAGPDLGFDTEPASAISDAIVAGIEADALEVVRGGDARTAMARLTQEDPGAVNRRFLAIKVRLEDAVRDHTAL